MRYAGNAVTGPLPNLVEMPTFVPRSPPEPSEEELRATLEFRVDAVRG